MTQGAAGTSDEIINTPVIPADADSLAPGAQGTSGLLKLTAQELSRRRHATQKIGAACAAGPKSMLTPKGHPTGETDQVKTSYK